MRRLWNTLDTVLRNTSDKDRPCYPLKRISSKTGPVMVRLINGRITLAGPGSSVTACPPLAVGRCFLTHREADDNAVIWLGLPPCVTGSEIEVLLRRDGLCRNNLITMSRLAGHLEEGKDVYEILVELDVIRSRIEQFLHLFFACEAPCPVRARKYCPKDMLVLGLADRKKTERMVQRFIQRFACRPCPETDLDKALKELAALAAAAGKEQTGGTLGDWFSGCETVPALSCQEVPEKRPGILDVPGKAVPACILAHLAMAGQEAPFSPCACRPGMGSMHGYRQNFAERQA